MNKILSGITGTVVLNEFTDGVNVVQSGTPLKFVNYFDGMLMRADTMKLEQQGLFNLSQLSNQAGGHGVVWGYDSALSDGNFELGSGMAINSDGRVVYLPGAIELSIDELINKSSSELINAGKKEGVFDGFADCEIQEPTDSVTVIEGTQYYVITVDNLNALCGEEEVYGRLCEEACVSATDRPYQLNGVVVRAEALPEGLILPQSSAVTLSGVHLRSRIASAYYAYEKNSIASQISGQGLAQETWCNGARLPGGFTRGVPVALLARQGSENLFLDRWVVARERMETPPRNYWAQVMAMRPWNQFLAQVLQFQCQINNLFGGDGVPVNPDPCAGTKEEITNLSTELEKILAQYQPTSVHNSNSIDESAALVEELRVRSQDDDLIAKVKIIQAELAEKAEPSTSNQNRILISGGIVETPSAGYLPVSPDAQLSVNEQVRNLMGDGVDLKFCVVRPDFIPHALEEAQHMERISLLQGLDDPNNKPKVDVLVPDGYFSEVEQEITGTGYEMQLELYSSILGFVVDDLVVTDAVTAEEVESVELDAVAMASAVSFKAAQTTQRALASSDKNQSIGVLNGVGRGDTVDGEGFSFAYAGIGDVAAESDNAKRDYQMGVAEINNFTSEVQSRKVALWTDMMIAKAPMQMQIGESTKANLDIDLVANFDSQARFRIQSSLNVKVTDKRSNTAEVQLSGEVRFRFTKGSTFERSFTIDRTATIKRGNFADQAAVLINALFSFSAKQQTGIFLSAVRQHKDDTHATFVLTARDGFSDIKTATELNKEGLSVKAVSAVEIAQAKQVVSSEVFNPTHPLYEASYESLNLISNFANQSTLTEIRANRLFDTGNGFQQSDDVYAAKDWVFFHRRRDKVCAKETEVTQALDRSYRVFTLDVGRPEVVGKILEAISRSQWDDITGQFKLTEVTDVSYLANSSSLKTSQQGLLSDWNLKVADNVTIHSGVIANNAQWQESSSLAQARGQQLNQVIDNETQITDSSFVVSNSLPSALFQSDKGAIIYFTVSVITTCQSVFSLPATSNFDDVGRNVKNLLAEARSREELVKNLEASYLGDIEYVNQTADFFDTQQYNQVKGQWSALGYSPVNGVISLAKTPQTDELVLAQSVALAKRMDPDSSLQINFSTTLDIGGCWGVTFLVPDVIRENALYYYRGVLSEAMLSNMNEALISRGSEALIADRWVAEGAVNFDRNSTALNPKDLDVIHKSVTSNVALAEGVEWRAISVHPQGTTAAIASSVEKESVTMVANMVDSANISSVTDANTTLRNSADGITLMVPVDTTKKESVLPVAIAASNDASREVAVPNAVFHFDENNDLIKDERYEEQIKKLKASGVTVAEAEMVGKAKPKNNDKRLTAVFAALKENEILTADAAKKTTKLKAEELSTLDVGSFRMSEALVLRPQ